MYSEIIDEGRREESGSHDCSGEVEREGNN